MEREGETAARQGHADIAADARDENKKQRKENAIEAESDRLHDAADKAEEDDAKAQERFNRKTRLMQDKANELYDKASRGPKKARLDEIEYDAIEGYRDANGDPGRQQAVLSYAMADLKELTKGRDKAEFADPFSAWKKMQDGGESIDRAAKKLEALFGDAPKFAVMVEGG